MAAVMTDHERRVHQREPLFFVELGLLTKLFFGFAKDTPFSSRASQFPAQDGSSVPCNARLDESIFLSGGNLIFGLTRKVLFPPPPIP